MNLERKCEPVPLFPTVRCQQRAAGDKIRQGRSIGRRSLGALAGNKIELCHAHALLRRTDQFDTAVDLINDLADLLLNFRGPSPRYEQSADPEMDRRSLTLRNERIGRLLDAVMQKCVGAIESERESRAN